MTIQTRLKDYQKHGWHQLPLKHGWHQLPFPFDGWHQLPRRAPIAAPGNLVRIVSDKTNEVWFGLVTKVVNRAPGPQIAIVVTYYQVLEGGLRVANDDLLDLTVTVTNPNEPPSTSPPTPDVGIIDGP